MNLADLVAQLNSSVAVPLGGCGTKKTSSANTGCC